MARPKKDVIPKSLSLTRDDVVGEKATEDKTPADFAKDLGIENLTDIHGIGDKAVEKLKDICHIVTIEDLATSRPEEIASMLKIQYSQALAWTNQAMEAILPKMELSKIKEIDDVYTKTLHFYRTYSANFNRMLGGGARSKQVTGTAGEFSTGKTVIGFDLAIDCITNHFGCPKCYAVLKEGQKCSCGEVAQPMKAVIIETEPDTVHLERLKEMIRLRGVNNVDWDRLYYVPAKSVPTVKAQFLYYKKVLEEMKKGANIGLVVVDSFNAKLRAGWSRSEMLPYRTRELAEHINLMNHLSAHYNIAWYLTCQVIAPPRPEQGNKVKMKYQSEHYPVGGDLLLHSVHNWIALDEVKKGIYEAQIFDSSYLPHNEAIFKITGKGIEDTVKP